MIQKYNLKYSPEEFVHTLNQRINPNATYIRPCVIKALCRPKGEDEKEKSFSLILRITLEDFFKYRVHLMNIRPVRTTRAVRWEQIKAGRRILVIVLEDF